MLKLVTQHVHLEMLYSSEINDFVLYYLQAQEEAFYVCDIGDIIRKHKEWKSKLPRVVPFYGTLFEILSP